VLLERPRSASVRDVAWTDADAALVDEADALCGPVESARPRSARGGHANTRAVADAATRTVREMGLGQYMTAADLAARFTEPGPVSDGSQPARADLLPVHLDREPE